MLAIDAFSGDAIPVHLLTKEAVALYMKHLEPDGILAVHISNRHFRLFPVVRAIADSLGLAYMLVDTDYASKDIVHWNSTWVLVARDRATLAPYGSPDDPTTTTTSPSRRGRTRRRTSCASSSCKLPLCCNATKCVDSDGREMIVSSRRCRPGTR